MPSREKHQKLNPFRQHASDGFVCGEPQEEALTRIDYLNQHGAGWCLITGPTGSGKSMLLKEFARRVRHRGESCISLNLGFCADRDWLTLVAEAWNIAGCSSCSPVDLACRLEEHLAGFAAIHRPVWILVDDLETMSAGFEQRCRWLVAAAERRRLALTIVIAQQSDACVEQAETSAHPCLELWPWETTDCERYISHCLKAAHSSLTFTEDAIAALYDHSAGNPGQLAKLCEWTWLAAQAESLTDIDADLVVAVVDELHPHAAPPPSYERSAAYGGW